MRRIIILAALILVSSTAQSFEYSYEKAVKKQLRDPASAQFTSVDLYSGGPAQVYCGYVNAKNGFGGYTGKKEFIAAGDVAFIRGQMDDREFVKTWKAFCK